MNCKDCGALLSKRDVKAYVRTNKTNTLLDYTSPVCASCVDVRRKRMLVHVYAS